MSGQQLFNGFGYFAENSIRIWVADRLISQKATNDGADSDQLYRSIERARELVEQLAFKERP